MFRRDHFNVPPAARRQLSQQDALRGFVPEPPAAPPAQRLAEPVQRAAGGLLGGGGNTSFAYRLIRDYGPTRALAIARAEGRMAAALLIERGIALAHRGLSCER